MPDATPADVTIALDGADGCIAGARTRTSQFLTRAQSEHGLPVTARTMDLAQLVVSELVDNAFMHGRGQITLRAAPVDDRIRVEVIDEGQGAAIKIREDGPELGGWGLRVVDGVAAAWGAYEGTTHVWADVPTAR